MSNRREKSLGINAVLNGIKTILSIIFPLITYPYAARVLQVENIGKVDFANSIVSYFILLAGLGISTYAIREGARVRDKKESLQAFADQMFTLNLFSTIIAYILLFVMVFFVPKFHSYSCLILVQSLALFGNLIGVSWIYTIVEDYLYITIMSIITHIVALVLMLFCVHTREDYILYAATSVIANVGGNLFNFIYAKKYVRVHLTSKINFKRHIRPILIIFASTITTTIYVNSDKTILGFLSDEFHVGLYSISVNVYTVLKSCIVAVILVSLPRLSNYIAMKKNEEYEKTATDIFKAFMLLLMPVVVGIFATADSIIKLVGGDSYVDAVMSLQILSISLIFAVVATYYTNVVLLPNKEEIIVLKGTILSAVVNILFNLLFIGKFQQNAAAFTTVLAEGVMCIYQFFYVEKYLKIKVSKNYIVSIILGCFGIVLTTSICNLICNDFILNIILKIFFSAIVYFLILFLLKNDVVIKFLTSIKSNYDKGV